MYINEYFKTPIWNENKPEFIKSLNKASNKYIKESKKLNKKHIKKHGDFGLSHHSTPLTNDNDFLDFRNYIGEKSWEFLDHHGYDMKQYQTMFSEMWVQEFSKNGGGHHSAHVHWNQHVSGFYFLKASDVIHFKVKPGTLIIFPGYLEHEFSVDYGNEPFRFIHWNIQAVPKEMAKDVV